SSCNAIPSSLSRSSDNSGWGQVAVVAAATSRSQQYRTFSGEFNPLWPRLPGKFLPGNPSTTAAFAGSSHTEDEALILRPDDLIILGQRPRHSLSRHSSRAVPYGASSPFF